MRRLMARIIPAFTVRCQTNETGLTADKIRLLFRYCVQAKPQHGLEGAATC